MTKKESKMNNLKRTALAGILIAGSMGVISESNANTLQNNNIYSTTTRLNLRRGPGTEYGVIKTLNSEVSVTLLSNSNGWAKVKVGAITGFCSAKYLKNVGVSQNTNYETYYVYNTESVNVRVGPSTSTGIYTKLNKNTPVKVIEKRKDGWYKIILNGKNY